MPPDRWRLFVAVPLPDSLRQELSAGVESWRAALRTDDAGAPDSRWTDPAAWHVTLAFLGATPPEDVPRLLDALHGAVGRHEGFVLPSGGLDAFPRPSRARVLWYGVRDDGRLASLASDVRRALGVDASTPFSPHVTLARLRVPAPLAGFVRGVPAPEGQLPVREVKMMRSHLGRGPARYEELGAIHLQTAEAVMNVRA
jgi:2'-5' RNA ligase